MVIGGAVLVNEVGLPREQDDSRNRTSIHLEQQGAAEVGAETVPQIPEKPLRLDRHAEAMASGDMEAVERLREVGLRGCDPDARRRGAALADGAPDRRCESPL